MPSMSPEPRTEMPEPLISILTPVYNTDVDVLEHHVGEHRERLLATSAALADLASEIEAMTGQIADAETLGRLRWIPAEEAQP